MTRRGRRWLRLLTGLIVAGVALWLLAPTLASMLVRWQLQGLIAKELDARLDVGKLIYRAPFGVTVTDASLVAAGPDGQPLELLRMPRLDLTLGRRPWASGPLLIENVVLVNPSVHLIHTTSGIWGLRARATETESKPPPRLSEILRLSRFQLQSGSIEYDDLARAGTLPLVWKNINVDLNTSQVSQAGYAYHLNVNNDPLARLETSGVADLDELTLQVDRCTLVVHVDPAARESALSGEIQEPLKRWQARGVLTIDTSGKVAIRHPEQSTYHSTLELTQASARLPGWGTPIDHFGVKIELTDGSEQTADGKRNFLPGQHPTATIHLLEATGGDAVLRLNHAMAVADMGTRTWKLTDVSGHIDPGVSHAALPASVRGQLDQLKIHGAVDFALDAAGPIQSRDPRKYQGKLQITPIELSVQPPGFDGPIGGMTPLVVHVADGVMTVETLRGTCGDNLVFLKQAHLSLNDFPSQIRLGDLGGCITFGPQQKYPPVIARQLESVKPVGPFFFNGSVTLDNRKKSNPLDYNIQIHTTRGRMEVTEHQIPVTNIDTVVNVTPAGAVISRFEASALEGSASATGRIDLTGHMPYQINVSLRDFDLAEIGRIFSEPGKAPLPLSGHGVFKAQVNGQVPTGNAPAWSGVAGNGEFEILGGNFWQIPMMKSISDSVNMKQALTVGEAAGQFRIGDGKIHFDRAVANSPALGVEGSGDVTFDGRLDFRLIANILGNWGERAGNADGGGIAKLLDVVQHGVNVATQQALYQVQLTGKASDPKASAIPAPFLTKQAARLLGAAADTSRKTGLLDALHHESKTPTTTPAQ